MLLSVFSCLLTTAAAQSSNPSKVKFKAEQDELKKVFSALLDRVKTTEQPKDFFWRPILIGPSVTAINNYNKMVRELNMSED